MDNTNMPQNSIDESKRSATIDTLLMLCVPLAVAIFNHGFIAILNVAISLITCLTFTSIGKKFLHSEFPPKPPHSYIIGVSTVYIIPVKIPAI